MGQRFRSPGLGSCELSSALPKFGMLGDGSMLPGAHHLESKLFCFVCCRRL